MNAKTRFLLGMSAVLLLAATCGAQGPPAAKKPLGRISDLAWMEGRWVGELGPNRLEQMLSAPKDGMMIGMLRLWNGDQVQLLEMYSARETADGLEMRIRHFGADLGTMEKGESILLRLTKLDGDVSEWENPVNGEPKRTLITRKGDDMFHGHSEIVHEGPDARTSTIDVEWRRAGTLADRAASAGATTKPAAAKAEDFDWMAGRWRGSLWGGVIEQQWFPSAAGVTVGSMRYVRDGKLRIIELYTVAQSPMGLTSWTRQFDTELKPEGDGTPLIAVVVSATPEKIVFHNLGGKLDIQTVVTRHGEDAMNIRTDIIGGEKPAFIEVDYQRVK